MYMIKYIHITSPALLKERDIAQMWIINSVISIHILSITDEIDMISPSQSHQWNDRNNRNEKPYNPINLNIYYSG